MELIYSIIGMLATLLVWAFWQKGKAEKAALTFRREKVNELVQKAKTEVDSASLDELIADGNKRYPGKGPKPD